MAALLVRANSFDILSRHVSQSFSVPRHVTRRVLLTCVLVGT